jgi:hypothetical protein
MVDMRLFTHRIILSGVMMAMTALITLVGFELLMAQELQFVHGKTPFEAGLFMLPLMVASGFSGPLPERWFRGSGCARWQPAGCCSARSVSSACR